MQTQYRHLYSLHAQLRSFARQREAATCCLRDFLARSERPYVTFSGGKDSTCLLVLLASMERTDVPVFTQADDLDWPQKRAHCERVVSHLRFTDYLYAESMVSALDQFARLDLGAGDTVHGTFSHVVRDYVRERDRDGVILGLRSEEAQGRMHLRRTRGRLFRTAAGEWRALPIADWSGRDIFALIVSTETPYMDLYDCDDTRPPHEIRMSWMLNPQFLADGAASCLRRHSPEQFRRLTALNPQLGSFT